MTVFTYRFRRETPVDQDKLRSQIGATTTFVATDGGQIIDITSDDAADNPDVLKEQMGFLGFTFLEIDPATDPADSFTPKGAGGGGGGGVRGIWRFNTSTGGGDPGGSRVAFDSGTFAGVATMYINDVANDPTLDFGTLFLFVNVGDECFVQQNDDSDSAAIYRVTSITDSTGFWTFGLSFIDDAGGAMIGNNKLTTVGFSSNIKHNPTATTDPTATDDENAGYERLSHWINTTTDEAFINVDATAGAAVWPSLTSGGGAAIGFEEWTYADDLTVPVTADWAINVVAPLTEEDLNSALHALMFDDTTEEGGATHRTVPSGAVRMIFKTLALPATAPPGAVVAAYQIRFREVTDNGAVTAWSAPVELTDIDFPASQVFHQKDETDNTLVTWGIVVGRTYQFLVSRDVGDVADNLLGDAGVVGVGTEWTT